MYKSFPQEATNAAKMAVSKVQGRTIEFDALTQDSVDSPTAEGHPGRSWSRWSPLTKNNIKDTVVQDGVYTVKDICTAEYAADCAAIGLN